MRNKTTFGFIVLIAIIGFSFGACSDGGDSVSGKKGVAPIITTASLPGGTVGTVYSETLAATGDEPITWSLESGALPTGINIFGNGVISGTPITEETFTFTVRATNAAGSATKNLSIAIADSGGGGTAPAIITASLPNGTAGIEYRQTLSASGDTPITWSLDGGTSLPTGLNLAGAVISGTPTTAGTSTFTVKAENAAGSVTKSLSITIAPASSGGGNETLGVEMVQIPGGPFTMGSPAGEAGRETDETPHQVTVTGFSMSKYLVTQAQYEAVTGTNPSYFKTPAGSETSTENRPVEQVSWYNAVEFCNALSLMEGLTPAYTIDKSQNDPNNTGPYDTLKWLVTWNREADGYRLPTEAEWEYACRAGTTGPFNTGNNITTDQANYDGNYPYNGNPAGINRARTSGVDSFEPNAYDLCDMHGNVFEWCWDWYGSYESGAQSNPTGAVSGAGRVERGGSWEWDAQYSRSAYRANSGPHGRSEDIGFRLVCPATSTGGGGTAPAIITANLPDGSVGMAYSQTLSATGETPITWTIDSGALPAGLNLAGAVISGTPTTANTYTFTVKATNVAGSGTKSFSITIFGSTVPLEIEMVPIQGGSFSMGSPAGEVSRETEETPHQVTLTGFSMSKYLVTQAQYEAVMGNNPSNFKAPVFPETSTVNRPVEQVTWYDAVEFCNKLSEQEGLTPAYTIDGRTPETGYPITAATVTPNWSANGYRLPTEAEWEYACRAGTTTVFNTGNNITTDQANYDGNYPYNGNPAGVYRARTTGVGSFVPNAYGLYDMHGNVHEWCWDWSSVNYYSTSPEQDPTGAATGYYRVIRGGSWYTYCQSLRSARRSNYEPKDRSIYLGFRIVREGYEVP